MIAGETGVADMGWMMPRDFGFTWISEIGPTSGMNEAGIPKLQPVNMPFPRE